jgi:hypothetical protein
MSTRIATVVLASVVIVPANVQERPDFSGEWWPTHISDTITGSGNSGAPGSLELGRGALSMNIVQDERTLTVESRYVAGRTNAVVWPRNTIKYPLDGRKQANQVVILGGGPGGAEHATAPAEHVCEWKGKTLVATFTMSIPGEPTPRQYEETFSLNADGNLVIKVTRLGTPSSLTRVFGKK